MSNPNATKRGFTLIELLVVIAIIAILAAILFPVFAKVREKARQTTDLSNIKQAILAVVQYNNDYDESHPNTVTEREGTAAGVKTNPQVAALYSIRAILIPYTESGQNVADANPGIWKDPDTSWAAGDYDAQDGGTKGATATLGNGAPGFDSGSTSSAFWTTDIGFNFNEEDIPASDTSAQIAWFTANPDFGFNQTTPLASISQPANFIICADAARANDGTPSRGGLYPVGPEFNNLPAPTGTNSTDGSVSGTTDTPLDPGAVAIPLTEISTANANTAVAAPQPRHTGGLNWGFADGHAKWLHVSATITDWHNNYWRRDPTSD